MKKEPHKVEDIQENLSRRGFLRKIWLALGIVALVEFIGVGVAFITPRKKKVKEGGYGGFITAGAVEDFKPATVKAFRKGHFYLARLEDGGFLALSRTCTHLGCSVPWDEKKKKFICPCHASAFDISGNVISPPATRALDTYPIRIENKIIKVDTGKPLKRRRFDISQVVYP